MGCEAVIASEHYLDITTIGSGADGLGPATSGIWMRCF
jgi:hypothetical protein